MEVERAENVVLFGRKGADSDELDRLDGLLRVAVSEGDACALGRKRLAGPARVGAGRRVERAGSAYLIRHAAGLGVHRVHRRAARRRLDWWLGLGRGSALEQQWERVMTHSLLRVTGRLPCKILPSDNRGDITAPYTNVLDEVRDLSPAPALAVAVSERGPHYRVLACPEASAVLSERDLPSLGVFPVPWVSET
jgi:hypothetical protein